MSQYYNPNRTRNIYDPHSSGSFRLSRGKIDNFVNCPRCFYLDRRHDHDIPYTSITDWVEPRVLDVLPKSDK